MTRNNQQDRSSNVSPDGSAAAGTSSQEMTISDALMGSDKKQGLENESVNPATRAEVLARDDHRCQVCGREGPERGGLATLHVHHIERDPDGIDEDDPENLTTLCRSCHSWIHQQSTPADAPVTLTEADLSVLLPQDIEILRYLAENGPARTGMVAEALTAELSMTAVRERLAVLMGLDNMVEQRDRQVIDQDVESGEWGLTEHIEPSARGHIPDDPQSLLQRMEDEQVRQALERGCDRQEIMNVLDISRRTTFHREKRAYAYDFPLDVFRRSGRGGQHPASQKSSEEESDSAEVDDQQRLDAIGADDNRERDQAVFDGSAGSDQSSSEEQDGGQEMIQEQLEVAITALQRAAGKL